MVAYQLFEIPVADLHVTIVIVHALRELLNSRAAVARHLLILRILSRSLLSLGRGRRSAAREEISECMTYRRTDGDAAVRSYHQYGRLDGEGSFTGNSRGCAGHLAE